MCPTRHLALLAVAALAAVTAACGDDDGEAATRSASTDAAALTGTVTVLAAASLSDAFAEIATAFERAHEGVDVALSFDGSARLAAAIIEGVPADVFVAADEANAAKVADAGLVREDEVVVATNEL
jgi:molybdate transport system substrate-binding protein